MAPHACPTRHCILPPHLLEAIQVRGNAAQRATAQALINEGQRFRAERDFATRQARTAAATEATEPGAPRRRTFDAKQGIELPGELARREDEEAALDAAIEAAHEGAGAAWRLFRDVYRRDSIDGRGMEIWSTVHYGAGFGNAFWDGRQMVYGDGDGEILRAFPASLSVVGHELSHGVVQHSGGFVYRDEPGALCESLADVFGVLVVQHHRGQEAAEADWRVGEGIFTEAVSGWNGAPPALRSLRAPGTAYEDPLLGRDPQPWHMDGYVRTASDDGGVHLNAGIPSHAFYLLARHLGGRAWEKAGHVWYDALQGLDDPHAGFSRWADVTVGCAERRFGRGSLEALLTRRAWKAVGVPT